MKRVRTRNLDDETVGNIASLLDGWSGKLTWDLYIDAIERHYRLRYTRQALHGHERIRLAFEVRKRALSSAPEKATAFDGPPELKVALDEVARLEGENQRLQAENQALLEQFVRWVHNASKKNLTEDYLNQPLPSVDRERSNAVAEAKRARAAKGGRNA
jgi:hypothetical protein